MNLRQCTKQPSGAMPKRNIILGIVIMMGGTICGNKVGLVGGGVTIESGGKFIMEGGKISGNTSVGNGNGNGGGGVVVWNGEFTMSGGEITQNKAGERR